MSDLVRFGVAMERSLLNEFDERIATQGYENRSEALRDLVRDYLVRAAWEAGAHVIATLTIVFRADARDAVARISEVELNASLGVVATLRVPLDEARALAVLTVRGRAADLGALAGNIGGMKGVLSCELTLAATTTDAGK
ncbi:MAG: nickel-responsive transcriptional regulator NikR [Polyangiaceae bacterium]|nr:nickel-responsive transcriptional regulator NikR [Polyangiaceae bacterium]